MIQLHTGGNISWLNPDKIIQLMPMPLVVKDSLIKTAILIGHKADGDGCYLFFDEEPHIILEMMLCSKS